METVFGQKLTRFIAAMLFVAVVAGSWDAWWHGEFARESFWSPPHVLLYTSAIAAIVSGVYGWYRTKEKIWRRLAILLAIVPLSAPFDELWHRLFGVEPLSSPLIVWSPPHLLLIAAVIGSFALLLPLIRKDQNESAKVFFGSLAFAGILNLSLFLASPLQPTGPYQLLGFWGQGVASGVFVAIILIAKRWTPGIASATLVTIVSLLLIVGIGGEEGVSKGVNILPHDHPPRWLTLFSFIIPAVYIDLSKRTPLWIKSGVAGFLFGGILYSFAWIFFELQFQYTFSQALAATSASLFAGMAVGIVAQKIQEDTS